MAKRKAKSSAFNRVPHSPPVGEPDEALVNSYRHEWLHNEQIFVPLLRYNVAHLVMMVERKIVPKKAGATLIRSLRDLAAAGFPALPYDPRLDGLQPNIEAEMARRNGADIGGWLNTGRARQECELVARQVLERDQLLLLLSRNLGLRKAVLDSAGREINTVMPYYTWAQHAEPITFGYYAASVAHALAEDGARLRSAYHALNRSRADIGQIVPPPLPLDRPRVAKLLGFDGLMTNSLYAYTSMDVELTILSSLAVTMANLARLAENLFVWASPEFGFVEFDAAFSGTSYAMPQKKNPYALRMVRPIAARAIAAWNDAIHMFSGGLPMVGNGVIHVPNRVITCLGEVGDVHDVLIAALPALTIHPERTRQVASDHWAQAPQLVFLLVQQHGVPFRAAHHIVGRVVRTALEQELQPADLTPDHVEAAARPSVGRPLRIDAAALRKALDPEHVVATRTVGGPAPASVKSQLKDMHKGLLAENRWLAREQQRLRQAQRALDSAAAALARAA